MPSPIFPNDPNTSLMLAEVAAHQVRPEKDMPDVYAVVLAYAYDQETDPTNTELVHQWAHAFPGYAEELLAVSYARTAMGWRIDEEDDLSGDDVDADVLQLGREIIAEKGSDR